MPIKITDIDNTTGNYTALDYGTGNQSYLVTGIEHWTSGGKVSETVNTYTDVGSSVPFAKAMLTGVARAQGTPDEADATFGYNNNGFMTSESYATGTSDPTVSYALSYDLRGELITRVNNASNRWTGFAYDGLGNRVWEERHNESGALVGWNYNYYNANGEVEWHQGSRYNPVDYTQQHYDGAGRLSEVDQWRSEAAADGSGVEAATTATIQNQYDLFGDLLSVIDPNGNTTQMGPAPTGNSPPAGYDAIGRMLSRQHYDASGVLKSTEAFTYEPGDQIASYTNPLGLLATNSYTQTGQISSRVVTNPARGTESWLYRTDGRLQTYTKPDSTSWNISYDDYDRIITYILKDGSGNTLKTQTESFDRRGNII